MTFVALGEVEARPGMVPLADDAIERRFGHAEAACRQVS
jgi:hypothetical protein